MVDREDVDAREVYCISTHENARRCFLPAIRGDLSALHFRIGNDEPRSSL
jgi:hypothetical protein